MRLRVDASPDGCPAKRHVLFEPVLRAVRPCGCILSLICVFFFSSRRRHTRCLSDWSSDVCSSDLDMTKAAAPGGTGGSRLSHIAQGGIRPMRANRMPHSHFTWLYHAYPSVGVRKYSSRADGRHPIYSFAAGAQLRCCRINRLSTPMLNEVYNSRILELAGNIPRLGRLDNPDATATALSKLCGSTVTIDLKMDGDTVTDFSHQVKACALGQASSSIMAGNGIGAKT